MRGYAKIRIEFEDFFLQRIDRGFVLGIGKGEGGSLKGEVACASRTDTANASQSSVLSRAT